MATTYYVRPDGNNNNTGTGPLASQAFATLSKAASVLVAGDGIRVAPGIYRETVTPTVSSVWFGDRLCQYFTDMQIGDVIVSGLNSETATAISRTYGFNASSTGYVSIYNFDVENVIGKAFYGSNNFGLYNCNAVKGVGSGAILGSNSFIQNCKFSSVSANDDTLRFSGNTIQINNCVIKQNTGNPVFAFDADYSNIAFNHCFIEGTLPSPGSAQTLNLNGCVVRIPWLGYVANSLKINATGCSFISSGGAIYISTTSSFIGCLFSGFSKGLDIGSNSVTVSGCVFDTCGIGVYSSYAGTIHAINNCVFKRVNQGATLNTGTSGTLNACRFYACSNTATGAGITNASPQYGDLDGYAGVVASTYLPISGTKSLLCAGYSYAPVHIIWIPCEAGKTKTVKLKSRNNLAGQDSMVCFGDQSVTVPGTTAIKNLTISYKHHKTELVPLFLNSRVTAVYGDFVQWDDIAA